MLSMAGVEYLKYTPQSESITITFPVDKLRPTAEDLARKLATGTTATGAS